MKKNPCLSMGSILATLLFLLVIPASSISSHSSGRQPAILIKKKTAGDEDFATVVNWGQLGRDYEGSLWDTCDSFEPGDIVLISGLTKFGFGQKPTLNLTDHCNPADFFGCSYLSRDINACQRKGIKLFLSIGGKYDGEVNTAYGLESEEDAEELGNYIWRSFLGGFSFDRPFGGAVLDGVDFDIEGGNTDPEFWQSLADGLSDHSSFFRRVRVSGAVQCSIPDPNLEGESGLPASMDYAWIKFFGDESCEYSNGNLDNFFKTWDAWSEHTAGRLKLFVGVPDDPGARGYIPGDVLRNDVIPRIAAQPLFGGIMLWQRKLDPPVNQA